MKSYGQYCGLARALDLVGDRWSLLVIRELALGDRRYGELQRGLPGIATNLLAERLRHLDAAGIIERRTDPSGTVRHGLTPQGEGLLPALYALVRWATPAMVPGPGVDDDEEPRWVAFAASAYLRNAPEAVSMRIVLTTAGLHTRITVRDGTVEVGPGTDTDAAPDVHIVANCWALMGLISGSIELDRLAVLDPHATVVASPSARRALTSLLDHNAPGRVGS